MKKLYIRLAIIALCLVAAGTSSAATFVVTKLSDTNDGVCDADCSLREAVAAANAAATDDIIDFHSTVFGGPRTIVLDNGEIVIETAGGLTINGTGVENLRITSLLSDVRHFEIVGEGSVVINKMTIYGRDNLGLGGGIENDSAQLTLNEVVLTNNSAQHGGAIFNLGGTVRINDSLIHTNSTIASGGAIQNFGGDLYITNSTITKNSAVHTGGAIENVNGGLVDLASVTIANNTAMGSGGGISNTSQNNQVVNALNTIIADNVSPVSPDVEGYLTSQGYNLIENTSGTMINGSTTGIILGKDPYLTVLGINGGPTQTIGLRAESPAIDAGDPLNFPAADQRGIVRPQDGDIDGTYIPDIGAYERQVAVFTVTNATDVSDVTGCDEADCSLREAIQLANFHLTRDRVIVFGPLFETPQTITLSSDRFSIIRGGTLSIKGPGRSLLTISGNDQHRLFFVEAGSALMLSGMTLTRGVTSFGTTGAGGITNPLNATTDLLDVAITDCRTYNATAISNDGSFTVTNSSIFGNQAESSGGAIANTGEMTIDSSFIQNNTAGRNGGAIDDSNGKITITDSIITGNRVTGTGDGGAIYTGGGDIKITGSTISGSSAVRGGAVYATGFQPKVFIEGSVIANCQASNGGGVRGEQADITIIDSTIRNNSATFRGGGVLPNRGSLIISGSTISGNSSVDSGGGVAIFSDATLTNSTITNNSAGVAGGGIFNGIGETTANHLTISGNTATSGGGVGNGSSFRGRNLLIADNGSNSAPDFGGEFISQGYNLIETVTGMTMTGVTTGNILGQDPRLGPLSNNGGLTLTRALSGGSPAIDAGDPINFISKDQRGIVRPLDGNSDGVSRPDIGAFERPPTRTLFDFDGDGRSDISVFRPAEGSWYLNLSLEGFTGLQFGTSQDRIVPADFDGDGRTDVAVFRPSTGIWYVLNSATGTVSQNVFGVAEDLPTPADYDGDGKADLSVFRPSEGSWYRKNSGSGTIFSAQFGAPGDKPTLGDFDGDGKADIALFRPSSGEWYQLFSGNGTVYGEQFGVSSDLVVPADYDGDGKTDIAIYRPAEGLWYVKNSSNMTYSPYAFGVVTDIPVPADFDGDAKADIAVFRPSNGVWYIANSTNGSYTILQFGAKGDRPSQSSFVR